MKENNKNVVEIVTRVKAFVINPKNEILVAYSYGGVQLVGGHVESDEDLEFAMIRELKEESGIQLDEKDEIKAFFELRHPYSKKFSTGRLRESRIVFYMVRTEKLPNLSKMQLTKRELENELKIEFVSMADFENLCKHTIDNNEKEVNRIIAKEMLIAFDELKKHLG